MASNCAPLGRKTAEVAASLILLPLGPPVIEPNLAQKLSLHQGQSISS
jgi:hypothetical protein